MMKNNLDDLFKCPICYDMIEDPVTTICGHNFCHKCFIGFNSQCAVCRTKLNPKDFTPNYHLKTDLQKIKQIRESSGKKVITPGIKSIAEIYKDSEINIKFESKPRVKRKFTELYSAPVNKTHESNRICGVKLDYGNLDLNKALEFFSEFKGFDIFTNHVNVPQNIENVCDEMLIEFPQKRFKYN